MSEEVQHEMGLVMEVIIILTQTTEPEQLRKWQRVPASPGVGGGVEEIAMGGCGFIKDRRVDACGTQRNRDVKKVDGDRGNHGGKLNGRMEIADEVNEPCEVHLSHINLI